MRGGRWRGRRKWCVKKGGGGGEEVEDGKGRGGGREKEDM